MKSPLFQMLNNNVGQQPTNSQAEQIKQVFKSGGNPIGLIPQNMQWLFNGTGNYQQMFYQMCRQQGINPQDIIDFLCK